MSSNDFDGSHFGPAGGRGADEQGAKALGAFGQGAEGGAQGASGTAAQYPAPEGWGNDGTWRDSSIDSNYETGVQGAVRPAGDPHAEPGYSYFSDGRGWESKPGENGTSAQPGQAPGAGAAGATAIGATAIGATAVGAYQPGNAPTSVYGGGPAGPGGYGAPMGPVPGGPGQGSPFGPGPGGATWPGGPGGPARPGGPAGPGGPRGPFGPNGKRKGNWWRHWTWKKALALTGGVFALFVIAIFGSYQYMASSATIPDALASANYQNTTVYYSDGKTVMGTIGTTDRQDLTYAEIPQQLQNAVVAAEDKNFWTEGGVSPTGIVRSAIHDVTDPGDLNGGSTITQEFVKNYYDGVGSEQTASRKIKEIFIAQKLAATKSKQWILTNYLNLLYMGEGSYGVEAAAETYFGVPVSKLTIAQDAVIGGILQQPSTYPLLSYRSDLITRWHYVLQQMVDDKYITAAQMSTMKFPTLLTDKNGAASGASITDDDNAPWVPYLMSQVESELTSPVADGGDGVSQQQLETGGLKIVTTISRSMEKEMYSAVSQNLNSQSISETSGATVTSLPSWALVGAELQDPKTGQILAEYPGKGQTMTAKGVCAAPDCQDNTAVYTREQVGSSFKPYVLATAVNQGMNVKTSTMDTSPYECIAPDSPVTYSTPITESVYELPGLNNGCSVSGAEKVENDAGELIGKDVGTVSGAPAYSDNVQDALAQSSNTGFSDLAHRVGTANIYTMAGNFGVNLNSYADGGSGLHSYIGDSGMALGIAPLTVNEQTQMLATIADNGLYHQAHIIKYWQQSDGSEQMPRFAVHTVLSPSEDAQVQYAMEQTTIDGTAAQTVTYGQQTPGTVIGKTGTTSSSHAGFFIGSTTQYTLVVGMFTVSQADNYPNNLSMLGGGGFGGYWPAKIWNTFAEAEFSPDPTLFSTSPAFTGSAWNLLGPVTKAKPTVTCTVNGHKKKISGKTCPTQNDNNNCQYQGQQNCDDNGANPSPSCSYDDNGNYTCTGGTATPSPSCSYDDNGNYTCSGNGSTATPTPTCSYDDNGNYTCDGNSDSGNTNNDSTTPTTSAAQGGLAVGGGLLLLPGSLLWTTISRRRRRKQRAGEAK